MKKTYIKPVTETITIETRQIIAASLGSLTSSGGPVDLLDDDATTGADAMAPAFGMWE